MTDRTINDADIRAYNGRRSELAELGITIPDLYGQDAYDDESDPTHALRHLQRIEAETNAAIAAERAAEARQRRP
jgi:hypothetical protein